MACLALFFPLLAYAQTDGFERINNERLLAPIPADRSIEIVDGDTLWLGIHQIRLYGIDALEPKQSCIADGLPRSYCHTSASEALRQYANRADFRCEIHVRDGENKPWIRYGRYIASCYAGSIDVNKELVRQGWAYADKNYGEEFQAHQAQAKANNLGIHATEQAAPWVWRREQRDDTCVCE